MRLVYICEHVLGPGLDIHRGGMCITSGGSYFSDDLQIHHKESVTD